MAITFTTEIIANGNSAYQIPAFAGREVRDDHIAIYLDDVKQSLEGYSVSGSYLIFTTAPSVGVTIDIAMADNAEDLPATFITADTIADLETEIEALSAIANNITTVSDNITDVSTVSDSMASVNTTATNIASVISVDTNMNDVKTTSASIGNIELVGRDLSNEWEHIEDNGSISDVVTGGTGTSSIVTVADNIVAIQNADANATIATEQADIATAKAGEASVSESNASASAATATTQAGISAAQAGIATTKANEASVSAINASTSEVGASASEANASASETNASASEANALVYKNSAETARDQTLEALDNFDDRYLGQKASDPTLDNDGDALIAGALYFNTTDDVMKVYEGSVWVGAYASLDGALLIANNLSEVNATASRTNLGLEIGVDVQAYDANNTTATNTQSLTNKDISGVTNYVEARQLIRVPKITSSGGVLKGDLVSINGTQGASGIIEAVKYDGTLPVLGMALNDIAQNAQGVVVTSGNISNIDTNGYSAGSPIYADSNTGTFTITRPASASQSVGIIARGNGSTGVICMCVDSPVQDAIDMYYDNTVSGSTATNVKDALDEALDMDFGSIV